MDQLVPAVRSLWQPELRFTIFSGILSFFGYKASKPPKGFQTMITFFGSMIPSELPFHFLLLQIFILYIYYPLIKKYLNSSNNQNNEANTSNFNAIDKLKKSFFYSGLLLSIWNLFCYFNMTKENILSVARFSAIMRRAGIEKTSKTSRWGFKRLVILLFPFTFLLGRNILKTSKVYAMVPKTLKTIELSKRLKLDIYWHKNRK